MGVQHSQHHSAFGRNLRRALSAGRERIHAENRIIPKQKQDIASKTHLYESTPSEPSDRTARQLRLASEAALNYAVLLYNSSRFTRGNAEFLRARIWHRRAATYVLLTYILSKTP